MSSTPETPQGMNPMGQPIQTVPMFAQPVSGVPPQGQPQLIPQGQTPHVVYYAPPPMYLSQPMWGATYTTTVIPAKGNFGTLASLIGNIFFGFFCPIISAFAIFAFDTSMMSRLGVLLGNFNGLFWTGTYLYSLWFALTAWYDGCWGCDYSGFLISGLVLIAVSFVFLLLALFFWKRMTDYFSKPEARGERPAVHASELGKPIELIVTFFFSTLFPFVGTGICLIARRTLFARCGSILGLSTFLLFAGLISIFLPYAFFTGNPILIVSLPLIEIAAVHFYLVIKTKMLGVSNV